MRIDEQKGSILIFSVLMLGVILTITLALGNIFLPKLRTATQAINSIIAIYAADSNLEWCLYVHRENLPNLRTYVTMTNGATTNLSYSYDQSPVNPICSPAQTPLSHTATSTYRGVIRSFILEE